MKRITAIAIVALLGSLSANAQIVFHDTFDGGDGPWGDLDINLAARQAGGTTGSTYTPSGGAGVPGEAVVDNDSLLMRIHNTGGAASAGFGLVNLDASFGWSLAGQEWVLSFSSLRDGTGLGAGWSGFSVDASYPVGAPFADGFGFILSDLGGWTAFNGTTAVGSGTLAYGAANHWYDIIATFDEVAGTVSLDFIDDLGTKTNLGTFPTSFGMASKRYVGFRNNADPISAGTYADMVVEDLQIEVISIVPPPEIGDITVDQLPGTNGLAVTWATDAGWGYAMQNRTNLLDGSWTNDIAQIVGTGGDITVTTVVDQAESFYRVVMEDFIHRPDHKQYLVFELTNVPLWDFDRAVEEDLVDVLGANNPASDRMYAFGMNAMPLLTRSVAVLNDYVHSLFDIAEAHGVPAYFHIDPVYGIGTDNIPLGLEPALQYWDHPDMCEWVNFPGAGQTNGQIPRSWVNWGSWVRLGSALPNYESPALQQFYISQLEDGILKPIKERLLDLQKEGKGYLFAGLNIGWETRFSDKSDWAGVAITNAHNPSEVMYEWEKAKTGYAALHAKGWDDASLTAEAAVQGISKARLFYDLCAESVHDNMELLAKTARDYGFYKSQIFSHIVALESYYSDASINNNVETPPVWTALNDYSTPGFTLDELGAAKYDLDEMENTFTAYGHEFKYGAVETYLVHYQTEAAYRAQLDEYFNNGTTLISVYGAVLADGGIPSAYTMNTDQAAAIRDWMVPDTSFGSNANGGFELGDWTDWSVTGTAFGGAPFDNDQNVGIGGWTGMYYALSRAGDESATGTLTSETFSFGPNDTVSFLMGGWSAVPPASGQWNYVALKRVSDDSEIDRVWAPNVTSTMVERSFTSATNIAENVYIEVVDNATGNGYSWISADDFRIH